MSEPLSLNSSPEQEIRQDIASVRRRLPVSPAAPYAAPASGDAHLSDYLKVLYKRRWTAIASFLLVLVSVTVYTFTAVPIFEARTRLLIEAEDKNIVNFKQVVEEDQTKADYYQTQYSILQSRALARRTLDQLKLWDTPPFGGPADTSFSLRRTLVGAPGAIIGLFKKSGETVAANQIPGTDETSAQSKAVDSFLGHLTVAPIRNSRLVDVKYRLTDPVLATSIVNALSRNYIEQNLEYKFMASKEASDWLGMRLAEERKGVEAAEAKLQQYREQNDAISLTDRENITVQKLADLNAALTRAKTERIQKEAMYEQLQASQADPARLDTFPAILTNTFIQQQKGELAELQRQHAQLSEKFGDKHPDIIRVKSAIQLAQAKLTGEISKVVQSVRSEYQAALAQENSLNAALNQQKNEALSMNRKAIDYSVLARDVESSKQMYNSLMQRAKETGVSGELKTSNIRIVDPAERPRSAVAPQKRADMMLGFAGAVFVSFGLVFFFEYLDNRIKTPEEITHHLGVAFLGMVPLAPSKGTEAGYALLNSGAPGAFAEAFRTIRTNVMFAVPEEGARSLLVTSTGAGEGKSLVSANLAIALAQTGQRVLIIDADVRKPKLHTIFGIPQAPGLSNLLVGESKASDCIRKSKKSGLWVLPAGRIPPNPAELLGSSRCREYVNSLKDHFDCLIIDSPPVMAVTDAALIAHYANAVIFVVRADSTSRYAAATALEQLGKARARIMGAVLNGVNLEGNPYYFSRYYRKEYTQYYVSSKS